LATHAQRGRFLRWVLLAFLVPTALAAWQLRGPTPLSADQNSSAGRTGVAAWVIRALLVAGAVMVLVWVFLTGDSGARSVWGG
jgi:small-conductance mechanosensitive channel